MDNETTAVATVEEAPPPAPIIPPIIQTKDGKLYRHVGVDGFDGYAEYRVPPPAFPVGEPYIMWSGPKFSLATWYRILAFFEWSYKEHRSEAQVRLYVNLQTGDTMAWAFPQRCVGMTTSEIGDHFSWPENEAMVVGYDKIGTVHHHCGGSAFQSGTDRHDEEKSNGLHITVGHIGSDNYDLHSRVILNGNSQPADLCEWFEMPEELNNLPELIACFRDSMFLGLLRRPPPPTTGFPDMWKANVKTYMTTSSTYRSGPGYSSGTTYSPPTGKIVSTSHGSAVTHAPDCCCLLCRPLPKGGPNGPFAASASSNGTPGAGAGKNATDDDVMARVSKALKKVTVSSPKGLEEGFMEDLAELIQHYDLDPGRALTLVCLCLVGDDKRYNYTGLMEAEAKKEAEEEKQWEAELLAEEEAQKKQLRDAMREAYGDKADDLYGGHSGMVGYD